MRILVITNDFPPRFGGINDYVDRLVRRLTTRHEVTVFTSSFPGFEAHDRDYPCAVVRIHGTMMLPTPAVARQAQALCRERSTEMVLFGAAWPLGHLGPGLRRACGVRYGAFAHGLELTAALAPGVLRHIGRQASFVTAVSDWARQRLAPAFGWEGRMPLLPSGVDTEHFHPQVSDAVVRARHGLTGGPVVACVSRLVPRKGQDTLISAWPMVRSVYPSAKLLVVGTGPYEGRLRALAERVGVARDVVFTGAVPYAELPAYFRAGDVFAMPCRARWFGFDIEALGAVFLQGAAVGRPVIAGDSGGAAETVQPGVTGLVVRPDDPVVLAEALLGLLSDPARCARMGAAGASWIARDWSWDQMAARLEALMAPSASDLSSVAGGAGRDPGSA